jgi:hypothetical protein
MNLPRFQNSPSGRLLKFGQGEAAYHAFSMANDTFAPKSIISYMAMILKYHKRG